MSRADKALIVVVAISLVVGGAAYVKWRDRRFIEVAHRIDACDDELAVSYKTASLGAPAEEQRRPDTRVLSWRRNGRILTVGFVTPASGKLVVGTVRVAVPRLDEAPAVLYEDVSGLRMCR